MNKTKLTTTSDISGLSTDIKVEDSPHNEWNNLFQNGFFFDTDGARLPDEWLADALLTDLAALKVITAGQLLRWIKTKDPKKTASEIQEFTAQLFRHNFIGVSTEQIPVPQSRRIRAGENKTQTVTVIHLTETGKSILSACGSGRYARTGLPKGTHLTRLYHDLLITEAVLLLAGHYTIGGIKCEWQLKSEAGQYTDEAPESFPDFKVWLVHWQKNGKLDCFQPLEGEIVVQTDTAQNRAKARDIFYFTANLRAADLIKAELKRRVVLLGDPALPAEGESLIRMAKEEIFHPELAVFRRRLKLFNQHNLLNKKNFYAILVHLHNKGPLTTNALAALIGARRESISRQLTELIRLNVLHSEAVQSGPGRQLGSPEKLFAFADVLLVDYNFRLKQLQLSQQLAQD